MNRIVANSVRAVILENEEDEGFMNRLKQGAKSFFGNGYGADKETNFRSNAAARENYGEGVPSRWSPRLKQRFNAAKVGYQEQGKIDDIDKVADFLNDLLKKGKIDMNTTVGQIVSKGKFAKGNLNTMRNRSLSQISGANNRIYR